ncbi:hypothetical protein [Gordonia sp. DT101]|uniref:hypothetical protein n=1 Tax=Gordonia sp. DT101 TaxID=3416545 RepID=UPI003CF5CB76
MALIRKRTGLEVATERDNMRFVIQINDTTSALTFGLEPGEALHLAGQLIEHASEFNHEGAIQTVVAATEYLMRPGGTR